MIKSHEVEVFRVTRDLARVGLVDHDMIEREIGAIVHREVTRRNIILGTKLASPSPATCGMIARLWFAADIVANLGD